ncbi:TRAP transporter small permease subunit [Arenibacterium sp. CAU 1754]
MAGSSAVLEDGSLVSRLDRALLRVERLLALASGLAVFGLMVLAVVHVGGRYFFNAPLAGYIDLIEQAMPLIAFMGISFTQRDGGHIRMDILIGRLRGRLLWAAEFLSVLLILILMLALVWGTWEHAVRAINWNAPYWSGDSSIDINLPLWPAKMLAPLAFSILSLRLVLQLWGFGRAFVFGLEAPAAVPMIQDVASQAAAEAEQLSERG